MIRLQARVIAKEMNIADFRGGVTWCYRFMKRHGLSIRTVTSTGQTLPFDWQEQMASFRSFVANATLNIDMQQIGNMDEVPATFDMPAGRTVEETGVKTIGVATSGSEKLSFTVVLGVMANGDKLLPMVIFKRVTMPRQQFPPGIIVKVNKKGWMNEEVMAEWLAEVWQRRHGAIFAGKKSLLVVDSARMHISPQSKQQISKYAKMAIVPGGLTKKLQPLDLTVNRSFKCALRRRWENWVVAGNHTFTPKNKMRRASYGEVCQWIVDSWNHVSKDCVTKGFVKAGIVQQASNSNSANASASYSDGLSSEDEHDDGLETLSGDLLDAFNGCNLISDDDFDGFDE